MEATVVYWVYMYIYICVYGAFPKLGVPTIKEHRMEKKMENDMETGII